MAISITSVFEVRQGSAATNGGFFVPGASGTDYSQQASPQYALTGLASAGAGNTILSAAAAADMVGNGARAVSGTNITVGTYEVVSVVVGVSITFSTNNAGGSICSGIAASGVINIGGALDFPVTADARMIAGNVCHVKANAVYVVTASQSFAAVGTAGNPLTFIGYTTTRGDGGQPTIRTSTNNLTLFSVTGAFHRFLNFIADCNSTTTSKGWTVSGLKCVFQNCKAMGFTTHGFNPGSSRNSYINCYATGGSSGATAAFLLNAGLSCTLTDCVAAGNACPGFFQNVAGVNSQTFFNRCIAANNTGASSDGFRNSNTSTFSMLNCISYGNGRDGLLLDTSSVSTAGDDAFVRNCIFVNNSGFGINSNGIFYDSAGVYQLAMDYNAFDNNSGGDYNNVPAGDNDELLSGDPFTDGASLDFSLDDTSGQGGACRASGFPGVLQAGGTGYLDRGALQHADPAGGSGMIMSRVRTGM